MSPVFNKGLESMRIAVALMIFCFSTFGYSHGLPGSELVFKEDEGVPKLSITFALDDLLFAAPSLTFLTHVKGINDLSEVQKSTLFHYLNQHFSMSNEGNPLTYDIDTLKVEKVFHTHVGEYQQVTLKVVFDSQQRLRDLLTTTLLYDVIMHEVRSHRADVLVEDSDGNRERLAHFLYQQKDGISITHTLSPPL